MSLSQAISGFGTLLKRGDSGGAAATKASKTVGTSNQQVVFVAKTAGAGGNSLSAAIVVAGVSTAFSMTLVGNVLTINSQTDGSSLALTTVDHLISAMYQDAAIAALFDVNDGVGNGSGVLVASAASLLTGGAAGGEVFSTIAEVTSLGGPNESGEIIEVTHMESDLGYKEYITSLHDGGEVPFNINFLPGNAGHQALRTDLATGQRRNYQIRFPDAGNTTYQFAGIVTGFSTTANLNDKVAAAVTLKVTGPIATV